MNIQTRPASKSDYDWLYQLHCEAYHDVITRQFGYWDADEELGFFKAVWESQALAVLIADETPVGIFLLNEYNDHLWLDELQIAAKYQNNGIGSQVVQTLLIKARKLGLPLRLRVLRENRAYKLYQRLGFYPIGDTEHHHVMEAI